MRLFEFQDPRLKKIHDFAEWAMEKLSIDSQPKFNYSNDKTMVDKNRSFGSTRPNGEIWVYIGDRNMADALRTLCHELVHHRQFEKGISVPTNEEDRFKLEDQANAIAGRMMRAYGLEHKDIFEGRTGTLQPDVAAALPATYAITSLPNQDPYLQYRFGVAIASAKGRKQREQDNVPKFYEKSVWGENEILVSFDPHIKDWIDDALGQMGMSPSDAKLISTLKSQEAPDVYYTSPVQAFKGYGKREE